MSQQDTPSPFTAFPLRTATGTPSDDLNSRLVALRLPLLVITHLAIFAFTFWLAYALRFDFRIPDVWLQPFLFSLPIIVAIEMGVFACFRAFNGWWRYFTFRDLLGIAHPLAVSFLIFGFADLFFTSVKVPRSVHVLNALLACTMLGGFRSIWRVSREGIFNRVPGNCRPAFIVCNRHDSFVIAHQINNRANSDVRLVGILSDNARIVGSNRAGMRVLGSTNNAASLASRFDVSEIWVVAGDVTGKEISDLKASCDENQILLRIIPESLDLDSSDGLIPLREIDIEDLLPRDPICLDSQKISQQIKGRCVMVTGAGGSIGSELCRQLLAFQPSELLLVDHRENSVFLVNNEFIRKGVTTKLQPCVGDILDEARMRELFQRYRPEFVYHAAAHKHVGLMEINAGQAIQNNILGTKQVADLANEFAVQKFVLVSTDKAVNPTSVMGCTKQIAERYVLALGQQSETKFVVVRFGNVLGSNGSVVPLFKEQIARGGPVTVTDERMTRFFMTIPEASQLVLQAGAMGVGGEIFVLDMGEQVKVVDLARKMIQLAGLPQDSIEIKFIGARPGEKLYEELYFDEEEMLDTDHHKIFAAYHRGFSLPDVLESIDTLVSHIGSSPNEVRIQLKAIIPDFQFDPITDESDAALVSS